MESDEAIHSQVGERKTFLGLVPHHIAVALPASAAVLLDTMHSLVALPIRLAREELLVRHKS